MVWQKCSAIRRSYLARKMHTMEQSSPPTRPSSPPRLSVRGMAAKQRAHTSDPSKLQAALQHALTWDEQRLDAQQQRLAAVILDEIVTLPAMPHGLP